MDAFRFRLRVFLGLMILVTLLGTFGFVFLEGLPLVDALYFSVVTVTTVGYGDVHPTTTLGNFSPWP